MALPKLDITKLKSGDFAVPETYTPVDKGFLTPIFQTLIKLGINPKGDKGEYLPLGVDPVRSINMNKVQEVLDQPTDPAYIERLKRFQSPYPFKTIKEEELDWPEQNRKVKADLVEDPFGNLYYKSEILGDLVSPSPLGLSKEKPQQELLKKYNENAVDLFHKHEELKKSAKDVIAENDQYKVLSFEQFVKAPIEDELLKMENLKRDAYNLPPLKKIPQFIKDQAAKEESFKAKMLILEDKQTGKRHFIGKNPNLPRGISRSSDIMKEAYPDLFSDVNQFPNAPVGEEFTFGGKGSLDSLWLRGDLQRDAPEEIRRLLKTGNPESKTIKEDFVEPLYSQIISLGDKKYFQFDENFFKYLDDKSYLNKQAPLPAVFKKPEPTGLLNEVKKQLGIIPELAKVVFSPNNPYIVDLGLSGKVPSPEMQQIIARNIKQEVEPSLVRIRTPQKQLEGEITRLTFDPNKGLTTVPPDPNPISGGSGFILPGGWIATADHVVNAINDRENTKILTPDDKNHRIIDIVRDPNNDVALIKVEGLESYKPVKIGSTKDLKYQDYTVTEGYPGTGDELEQKRGVYKQSGLKSQYGASSGQIFDLIKSSNPVKPGQSGGPIVNRQGEVISVNSLSSDNSGELSEYSVPIEKVLELLSQQQ